jgi:hypothetical protein
MITTRRTFLATTLLAASRWPCPAFATHRARSAAAWSKPRTALSCS